MDRLLQQSADQQSDIDLLQRDLRATREANAELRDDFVALRDCLEGAGLLSADQMAVMVHRRRWESMLRRSPAEWDALLVDIARTPGVLHLVLRYSGVHSIARVANCARMLHSSTQVSQQYTGRPKRLYVMGGSAATTDPDSRNPGPLPTVQRLDLCSARWEDVPPMPTTRDVLSAAASDCANPQVYAVGGSDGTRPLSTTERFDPEVGVWETLAPMPTPRGGLAVASVCGRLYAVGGSDGVNTLDTVEYYDFSSGVWAASPSLSSPRRGVAIAAADGILYVFGGSDGVNTLSSAECLDVHRGTSWTPIPPMPTPRRAASAACLDGYAYIVGGVGEMVDNASLNTVERLAFAELVWERVTPMPTARRGLAVLPADGVLYAMGGSDGMRALATVEVLYPAAMVWEVRTPMPTRRAYFGAAATQTLEVFGLTEVQTGGLRAALREANTPLAPASEASSLPGS